MLWPIEACKDGQGAPVQGFRLGVLALRVQEGRQGGDISGHGRVVGPKGPLTDGHGTARPRLTPGVPSAGVFQPTQVVVERRHLGVLRAKRAGRDGQGTPIQPRGRGKPGRIFVEHGQVIEAGGCFEMVRTQRGFRQCQGTLVERLGLGIVSLGAIDCPPGCGATGHAATPGRDCRWPAP